MEKFCEHHQGKKVEMWFNRDGVAVCVVCLVVGPHKGHDAVTIEEAEEPVRNASVEGQAEGERLELMREAKAFDAEGRAGGPDAIGRSLEGHPAAAQRFAWGVSQRNASGTWWCCA